METGTSFTRRHSPAVCLSAIGVLVAMVGAALTAPSASAAAGTITTVAGGGTGGDGVAATQSELRKPRRVAFLPDGGFLIVEFGGKFTYGDGRIRRVWPDGTISTVAGDGIEGFAGDGGPATAARMNGPTDVALTPDGEILVADEFNHRIRLISGDGTITTVAGSAVEGCGPQSGAAIDARFTWPRSLAVEADGGYLVLDENCGLVHRVSPGADGVIATPDDTIATVAGAGGDGFSGDGGPATEAHLHAPRGIAAEPDGGFLIADSLNFRIRRVGADGIIETVAGTGENGFGADGGFAIDTPLSIPRDVEVVPGKGFIIAESGSNRVRWVATNGVIVTLAGTGQRGTAGDGGPATRATIAEPHGVNISPDGDVYISGPGLIDASASVYRVRRVESPSFETPPLPEPEPVDDPTEPDLPPDPQTPDPPVDPPTVEAPPAVTAPSHVSSPSGPPSMAVSPSAALAVPARGSQLASVRLVVRGPHRVVARRRLVLVAVSRSRIAGRAVVIQHARRRAHRRLRYRTFRVLHPRGVRGRLGLRPSSPGVHRFRALWRDGRRWHRSAPVTVVVRPRARTAWGGPKVRRRTEKGSS